MIQYQLKFDDGREICFEAYNQFIINQDAFGQEWIVFATDDEVSFLSVKRGNVTVTWIEEDTFR